MKNENLQRKILRQILRQAETFGSIQIRQAMNNHHAKYALAAIIFGLCILGSSFAVQDSPYLRLFDEVCEKIETAFYDAKFVEEKFPEIKQGYKNRIASAASEADFAKLLNEMLEKLNASHTNYYTPHDYAYYHLAAIFSFLPEIKIFSGNKKSNIRALAA